MDIGIDIARREAETDVGFGDHGVLSVRMGGVSMYVNLWSEGGESRDWFGDMGKVRNH